MDPLVNNQKSDNKKILKNFSSYLFVLFFFFTHVFSVSCFIHFFFSKIHCSPPRGSSHSRLINAWFTKSPPPMMLMVLLLINRARWRMEREISADSSAGESVKTIVRFVWRARKQCVCVCVRATRVLYCCWNTLVTNPKGADLIKSAPPPRDLSSWNLPSASNSQ